MSNVAKIQINQRVFRWAKWWLGGIVAVGALLDAINNAISLFTPSITYIASTGVVVLWILIEILIKKKRIYFVSSDSQSLLLSRLGKETRLSLLGVIFLLWLPRIVDSPKENQGYQQSLLDDKQQKQSIPFERTPIFNENKIGYDSSRSIVLNNDEVDEELASIWKNSHLASNRSSNEIEVIERRNTFIIISAKGKNEKSAEIDWKIMGKRIALEKIATFSRSVFSNEDSAKHFFASGKLINLRYLSEKKEVELFFKLPITEE